MVFCNKFLKLKHIFYTFYTDKMTTGIIKSVHFLTFKQTEFQLLEMSIYNRLINQYCLPPLPLSSYSSFSSLSPSSNSSPLYPPVSYLQAASLCPLFHLLASVIIIIISSKGTQGKGQFTQNGTSYDLSKV